MKKRFLSVFLSVFVLFSSFSISVNASNVDNPNWVPVGEEMLNEFYMLFNSWGIFFAPNVSLSDVISTSPTAGIGFRINPDSGVLEIDSLYRLRSDDGVTFPSEFIEGLKNIVKEYPQKVTNHDYGKQYAIQEQSGTFYAKGYVRCGDGNPFIHDYYFNTSFDSSNVKIFGVFSPWSDNLYKIQFYQFYSSGSSSTTSIRYDYYLYDTRDSSRSYREWRMVSSLAGVVDYSFNFPIFNSVEDALSYFNGGSNNSVKQSNLTNYYVSNKFYNSTDSDVVIPKEMLTQNFQEINNNYYNSVNNYVANYNNENDTSLDTSALQAKIDEMQSSFDELLEEIRNSSGGGSGEGGGSSGDSSKDYSKDLEEINTSLTDIYKKLEEFYNKYKDTVDSQSEVDLSNIEKSLSDLDKLLTDFSQDNLKALEDMYKRLDDILTEVKNAPDQVDYSTNFDNIEQILADIQLLLTSDSELYHSSLSHIEELLEENNKQNKNFFDKVLDKFDDIITYLKKIYRVNVVDTIADIVSAITDLFDFASLAQRSSETANLVKTKFPFCMPFDLFATLGVLSAPAVIPHFELPFNFNIFGTQTENTISIDLTQYEKLATFSRDAFTVLFVVGLIMLTIKVFHGGDDDD